MSEAAYVSTARRAYENSEPVTGVRRVRPPHPKDLAAVPVEEMRAYAKASPVQQQLWDTRSEYGNRLDY